ncbi:MAG: hypothetical protein ACO1NN_12495 [Sphingopyxis sp.]
MADMLKSILMGAGCLTILSVVGCSVMSAGVMVAADRAADRALQSEPGRAPEKSPWSK